MLYITNFYLKEGMYHERSETFF